MTSLLPSLRKGYSQASRRLGVLQPGIVFAGALLLAACGAGPSDQGATRAAETESRPVKAASDPLRLTTVVSSRQWDSAVGDRVLLQLTAAGGTGGTYTFEASNLPQGLWIDTATGQIGGSPTTPDNRVTTIRVSDGASVVEASFGWRVREGAVANPANPPCERIGFGRFGNGPGGWEMHTPTQLVMRNFEVEARFSDGWIGSRFVAMPGRTYVATVDAATTGASGWAGMGIDYLDSAGREIGEQNWTLPSVAGESVDVGRTTVSFVAPPGAAALRLWLYADAGQQVRLSYASVRENDCQGVPPPVAPAACNLLADPGFESGIAGWAGSARIERVSDQPRVGGFSLQLTDGWSGVSVAAEAGRTYVAGGHLYVNAITLDPATGRTGWVGAGLDFLDASGRELAETTTTIDTRFGDWRQFRLEATAPAGTASVRLWFYAEGSSLVSIDDLDLRLAGCGDLTPPAANSCNRLADPGFEHYGTDGWEVHAPLGLIGASRSGRSAAMLSNVGWIGARTEAQAGVAYTARIHAKTDQVDPLGRSPGWIGLGVDFLDANGAELGEINTPIDASIDWRAYAVSSVAPAGTAAVRLWVYSSLSDSTGGVKLHLDDAALHRSDCEPAQP